MWRRGITVYRADYDPIYAAPLTEKDTLDGIYERFNIQRPADFTGHSLSVSDGCDSMMAVQSKSLLCGQHRICLNCWNFYKERNMDLQRETLLNEELQEIEIFDKPGLSVHADQDEDVPEGLYRYDLRGSDYGPRPAHYR